MGFPRLAAVRLLAVFSVFSVSGCFFSGKDCDYDAEECVGNRGEYRRCFGGEGQSSWQDKQCPGLEPVCIPGTGSAIRCEDRGITNLCEVTPLISTNGEHLRRVVDLDGGGAPDLVFGADTIALDDGSGAFEAPHDLGLEVAGTVLSILPARLDGDALLDLAVVSDNPGELYAFLGTGPGAYELAERYFVAPPLQAAVAGDLDGDGRDEIAGVVREHGVHLISGLGSPSVQDRLIDPTPGAARDASTYGVSLVEVDGNPPLDLAVQTEFSTALYLARSDGSYQPGPRFSDAIGLGDLDGDERVDVVTAVTGNAPRVWVKFAGADAGYGSSFSSELAYPLTWAFVADFDANGTNDLALILTRDAMPIARLYRGYGDGTFRDEGYFALPFDDQFSPFAADVDGDGRTDLVAEAAGSVVTAPGGCFPR